MAVLEKIRVKFGIAISVIIALSLLSFIIDPSQLVTALNSMSDKYDVGQIAGKSISYTDFMEDVDRYTTINQIVTGSSVQNEQAQKQIRDAAWQELIDRYMFIKNAKAAGITVGEDELVDLTSGENVSPVIAQNPAFADPETGAFSADALLAFLQQIGEDESGNLKTYWSYLQNTVNSQAFYSKYGSLFTKGNLENSLTLADVMAANNTTADVQYVISQYPVVKDSTISVSESEVKAYYKAHKNNYKRIAGRDIEYVVFEVVPSQADIDATSEDMNAVYEEFLTTDNIKAFLLKNSERSYSNYWYKAGELNTVSSEIGEFVDGAAAGAVSPICKNGNAFYAAKVLAVANIPDDISVRVISAGTETEVTDSMLVDLRLSEPMKMTQTYIIPGLEVLFTAKTGVPQIIKTAQYGNLLAEVVETSAPVVKKQVAILEKDVLAGKETRGDYYAKANSFATVTNGTFEGYKRAIDSMHVYSHPMSITEATSTYGTIDQAKEVTRWAFDAKKGKASGIMTINNKYFIIATLKEIRKEGFAPVGEVASQIKETIYAEKLHEKCKAEVASKIEGLNSIEAVAEALGATVETKEAMPFSSMGSGVEPALAGVAAATEEGQISVPVAGYRGIYVVTLANKQVGSFYTEDDAKNFAAQKAQYSGQMLSSVMQEAADVKDNRARFF